MKKVLIIDNSPSLTGALRSIIDTTKLLKGEFEFIYVLHSECTEINNIRSLGFQVLTLDFEEVSRKLTSLVKYPVYLIYNSWRLSRIINKYNIDLVHVNDIFNMCAIVGKPLHRRPVITHIRMLSSSFPASIYRIWVYLHKSFSDFIIANSEASRYPFRNLPNSKVIYNCIPLNEKLSPPRISSTSSVKFVFLGNYIKGKGQDYALEAFFEALKINSNLTLTFVGGNLGVEKNVNFKNILMEKVREERLEDKVFFETYCDDIERCLKAYDIVLNFSESESFSRVCLEALYYGVPLIASDCGGPSELFESGVSGILVNNKDVSEMTAAMLKLADDHNLRQNFSIQSRVYVREKFNIQNLIQSMGSVYSRF